jgi:hypothetical protein
MSGLLPYPLRCERRGPCPPRVGRRAVRAAAVARRLQPAAAVLGGFVSTHLRVGVPPVEGLRPDVAVASGDPPVDGHTRTAPRLVVLLGGAPHAWLAAGVPAVWVVGPAAVLECGRRRAAVRQVGELLRVPWQPSMTLPVSALLGEGRVVRASSSPAEALG